MTIEQKKKQLEKRYEEFTAKYVDAKKEYDTERKRYNGLRLKMSKYAAKCDELKQAIKNLNVFFSLPAKGTWWIRLDCPHRFVIEHILALTDISVKIKAYISMVDTSTDKRRYDFHAKSEEIGHNFMVYQLSHFKEIPEEEAKRLIEIGFRCDNTPLGEIKYLKK